MAPKAAESPREYPTEGPTEAGVEAGPASGRDRAVSVEGHHVPELPVLRRPSTADDAISRPAGRRSHVSTRKMMAERIDPSPTSWTHPIVEIGGVVGSSRWLLGKISDTSFVRHYFKERCGGDESKAMATGIFIFIELQPQLALDLLARDLQL